MLFLLSKPVLIIKSRGHLVPYVMHGTLGPRKSAAKWHLDRFSHFAGHICVTYRHTDTQTVTLRATSVTIGHILCTARNGECDAA